MKYRLVCNGHLKQIEDSSSNSIIDHGNKRNYLMSKVNVTIRDVFYHWFTELSFHDFKKGFYFATSSRFGLNKVIETWIFPFLFADLTLAMFWRRQSNNHEENSAEKDAKVTRRRSGLRLINFGNCLSIHYLISITHCVMATLLRVILIWKKQNAEFFFVSRSQN